MKWSELLNFILSFNKFLSWVRNTNLSEFLRFEIYSIVLSESELKWLIHWSVVVVDFMNEIWLQKVLKLNFHGKCSIDSLFHLNLERIELEKSGLIQFSFLLSKKILISKNSISKNSHIQKFLSMNFQFEKRRSKVAK